MREKREFSKEKMQELVYDAHNPNEFEKLEDEMFDKSRWSVHYSLVFRDKLDDTLWFTSYSRGATECQDEQPFEFDGDLIECTRVYPYVVTTTEYRTVPKE